MRTHLLYFLLFIGLPNINWANEEFDAIFVDGPGVLSGDKGHFTLDELRGKQLKQKQTLPTPQNTPPNNQEFDQFKQWRKAKAENNSEYQEFLDWQAYRAFKIRQAAQKNSHKAD